MNAVDSAFCICKHAKSTTNPSSSRYPEDSSLQILGNEVETLHLAAPRLVWISCEIKLYSTYPISFCDPITALLRHNKIGPVWASRPRCKPEPLVRLRQHIKFKFVQLCDMKARNKIKSNEERFSCFSFGKKNLLDRQSKSDASRLEGWWTKAFHPRSEGRLKFR